jgi:hypothetical protein
MESKKNTCDSSNNNDSINLHNSIQNKQEKTKNNKINDDIVDTKSINCIFCKKSYSRNDSLKRHLLNCKLKSGFKNIKGNIQNQEIEKISQHMEILKNDNDELKKQLTNILTILSKNDLQVHTNSHNTDNSKNINILTNTNTNNGIITNNNFHIEKIEFGKEDLTKLTDSFFINTLMNCYGAEIPNKIIENIHFSPKFMENMNVYITDSSRDKAMIYDGKEWKITTASEVVDNLLDKAVIFCENKHDELREKIEHSEKHKKKINKEMDTMKIMTNYEPYDYNYDGQPIDIDGEVRPLDDFKRGKQLNERAKQLITLTLQNKKNMILVNEKKPQQQKYLKTK